MNKPIKGMPSPAAAQQLQRAQQQQGPALDKATVEVAQKPPMGGAQQQDAIQHQPPPAAVEFRAPAERPPGESLSQLGLLAKKQEQPPPATSQEVSGYQPSAKLLELVGNAQKMDGELAQRLLREKPDFGRDDLRYLLGWRPDANAVLGGESHFPEKVIPFDEAAVEAMLRHFGNIDQDGKISLWTNDTTFEGDRRLDMGDVSFLINSDGKLAGEIEQRAKATIDANDPFAALFREMQKP